jgi:TRAP-type C4-dicarboxylate transport system permease small subunit
MNRLSTLSCRALEGVIAVLLALMVVLVFGNVVLRYAFNGGITVSEELSRWLFVWMTFLGALVALREHGHLGTDMLVGRLGRTGKRVCLALAQAAMLGVTGLLLRGSWAQMQINLDVEAPVSGLSMAWVYGVGVVFAIGSGVILLGQFWRTLSGQVSDAELVAVQESEDLAQVDALHMAETPPLGQGPHSQPFRR